MTILLQNKTKASAKSRDEVKAVAAALARAKVGKGAPAKKAPAKQAPAKRPSGPTGGLSSKAHAAALAAAKAAKNGGKKPGPLKGPGNRKVKGVAKNAKQAKKQAASAFMQASKAAGRDWDNPGVPDSIMDWEGQDPIKEQANNLGRIDSVTEAKLNIKLPEGATLRRWV